VSAPTGRGTSRMNISRGRRRWATVAVAVAAALAATTVVVSGNTGTVARAATQPAGTPSPLPGPRSAPQAAPANADPVPPPGAVPTELAGLSAREQAAEAQPDASRARAAARARKHGVVIDDQSSSSVTRVANPDGTVTAFAYEEPLFVRQPGHRARLDSTLTAAPASDRDNVASGSALKDGLSVKRSADRGLAWIVGGATVTVAVVDAASDARAELGADGAVRYQDAKQDADVVVRSSGSGPATDLLLKDAAASPTLRLRVTDPGGALGGLGAATPFGGWRFGGSTDSRYLGLAPPFAYEQAGGQDRPPTPGSAHLDVRQERPGVYLVTETVDADWLKGKTYPVVLDPAFTDRDEGQLNDCQVYSGAYQYQNWCPGGMDYVRAWSGYYGSDNQKFVGRALLHPNVDQLTSDGGGTYLQDAYFGFYLANSTANNLHDVCAGGTFWGTGSNTTWANTAGGAPLDGNGQPRYCSSFWASTGQWSYPNVTDILRNSKNGAFPYYGFVLRFQDEVNYQAQSNFDGGASPNPAGHPFFAVTYAVTTQPPTNVTTQATNNGSTGTSIVTAAWSYPADNGGADLSYQTAYYAYLYTCDADYVGESGWLNRDTRTFQWSGLDPQQCYKAYVRAGNPAGVSGYGAGTSAFGYPQRPGLTTTSTSNAINATIDYPARAGPCRVCFGDGGAPLDQYLVRAYPAGQRWPNGTVLGEKVISNPGFGQRQQLSFSPGSPASNGWVPANGVPYSVDVFPHTPTGVSYRDPATGIVEAGGYGLIANSGAGTPAVGGLRPGGSSAAAAAEISTSTPNLTADVGSGQGDALSTSFRLIDSNSGRIVASGSGTGVTGSGQSTWNVPPATLLNAGSYSWAVSVCNSSNYCSPPSASAYFRVVARNPDALVPIATTPSCVPLPNIDGSLGGANYDPSSNIECAQVVDPGSDVPGTEASGSDQHYGYNGGSWSTNVTNMVDVVSGSLSASTGATWAATLLVRNGKLQQDCHGVSASAALYDQTHTLLATVTSSLSFVVHPGQPVPITLSSSVPSAAVATVETHADSASCGAMTEPRLLLDSTVLLPAGQRPPSTDPAHPETASPRMPYLLSAGVTNVDNVSLVGVSVLATWHDETGRVVYTAQGAPVDASGNALSSLAPGQGAGIYISVSDLTAPDLTKYAVDLVGVEQ